MKSHPRRVAANPVGLIARSLAFSVILATPVLAQQPVPTSPGNRTNPDRARQQDMSRREMQLRTFGNPPKKTTDPKKLEAIMAQVEEDFKRILILHNEIVRAVAPGKALDYDFVSDSTAEIKKRASRLQSTLALQRPEGGQENQDKQIEPGDAQVKGALIMLCKQIQSFVKNPVIETPGTVDAQQLEKARSDLEGVIDLSGSIRKTAERLKKTAK